MEIIVNIKFKSLIVGAILGAIVFQIAIYFIGYTAAIALPSSLSNWAAERSATIPVIFVWDLLVVQLLGVGILAALSTYVLLKLSYLKWLYVAIGFVTAETISSYSWLFSSSLHEHFSKNSYLLFTPHFIVVCLCVFIAASLGSKSQKV